MGSFSAKAAYSRNSPLGRRGHAAPGSVQVAFGEPGATQQRPRVRAALA
jgi:hypothetical protein